MEERERDSASGKTVEEEFFSKTLFFGLELSNFKGHTGEMNSKERRKDKRY